MARTRKPMSTWRKRSSFEYEGSVRDGTTIYYGHNFSYHCTVNKKVYADMLARFSGQEVSIGTSRTNPPTGSLGKWLVENCTRTALASYVGPILVEEGFAVQVSEPDRIEIKRFPG